MSHKSKPSCWAMGKAKSCRRPVTSAISMPAACARPSADRLTSRNLKLGVEQGAVDVECQQPDGRRDHIRFYHLGEPVPHGCDGVKCACYSAPHSWAFSARFIVRGVSSSLRWRSSTLFAVVQIRTGCISSCFWDRWVRPSTYWWKRCPMSGCCGNPSRPFRAGAGFTNWKPPSSTIPPPEITKS